MHELTERVENKLAAALSGSPLGLNASIEVAKSLSTEEKKEYIDRGQKAVSEVQVRELENMLSVLADDIFNDHQEHYYISSFGVQNGQNQCRSSHHSYSNCIVNESS